MADERTFESPPSLLGLYGKAALGAIPFADKLPVLGIGGRSEGIPDTVLRIPETRTDPDRLADYCDVCGFSLRDVLPPTYPHMLAFPLHMSLMCEEDFPFGAVGLVHISNRITQHRPIALGEALEIAVHASELEPHPKGRQFSVITEARSDGELVWESSSTNLKRGGGEEGSGGTSDRFEATDFDSLPAKAEWKIPADQGRRYASVSGDRNPIHMSEWTAKPLGFPKAIAHGMWTKARCLAGMESELPDAFEVEVRFKKPILLPSRVSFASVVGERGERDFAVRDFRKGTPHLEGILEH
ncbi:MAG: MaoC/PaaZ C-terminal domain-containing protein [Solirubrobacterales bacterium]